MNKQRNRIVYIFLTLAVVCLGLLSRKMTAFLPDIINMYLGDALWASMIFLIAGTIFNKWSGKNIAIVSLAFCYAIELSQLYHEVWIDKIRNTTLGGLVLGFGFLWSDLIAYAIGVGLTFSIEFLLQKITRHYSKSAVN